MYENGGKELQFINVFVDGVVIAGNDFNSGYAGVGVVVKYKFRDIEIADPLVGFVTESMTKLKAVVKGLTIIEDKSSALVTMYGNFENYLYELINSVVNHENQFKLTTEPLKTIRYLASRCSLFRLVNVKEGQVRPLEEATNLATIAASSFAGRYKITSQ